MLSSDGSAEDSHPPRQAAVPLAPRLAKPCVSLARSPEGVWKDLEKSSSTPSSPTAGHWFTSTLCCKAPGNNAGASRVTEKNPGHVWSS